MDSCTGSTGSRRSHPLLSKSDAFEERIVVIIIELYDRHDIACKATSRSGFHLTHDVIRASRPRILAIWQVRLTSLIVATHPITCQIRSRVGDDLVPCCVVMTVSYRINKWRQCTQI